eukprot:TRINITY_DN43162_c0_g1_i1.p1 TRINITY_DN43162_c0_g1~~TRINITY_DN43162_c0_g1_i1.p1  ORF type:complete len:905 (+),score=272.48 TRINITY_DN43162_c0_g1_i1:140-2854(+)
MRGADTVDAVGYLRSVGAADIMEELTGLLLEHRPEKDRVHPFLAACLLSLDAKGDPSTAGDKQRVLSQLPHAESAPAAAAIFACAQALGGQGVLDLALDSPEQGRRPSRWQARSSVEHNPFGACPVGHFEWKDVPGQEAAAEIAAGDPEPDRATSTPRLDSGSTGQTPRTRSLSTLAGDMLGLLEGAVQSAFFQKCPRQVAARVEIGGRATDFEAGVMVVPNKSQWKYGTLDGGGEGLVISVGMSMGTGAKSNIRVRWPMREYVHHRADRSIRLSPLSAWRGVIDIRKSPSTPGDAICAEGARAVGKVLKLGVPLREILLHNNQVGEDGAAALLEGLRSNTHVIRVDLSGAKRDFDAVTVSPQRRRLGSIKPPEEGETAVICTENLSPTEEERTPSPTFVDDVPRVLHGALSIRCAYNDAVESGGVISMGHLLDQGQDWADSAVLALWDVSYLGLPSGEMASKHESYALSILMGILQRRLQQQLPTPAGALLLYAAADGGADCKQWPTAEGFPQNPAALLDELLLQRGEISEVDSQERTPLHLAAEHGKVTAARELLRGGGEVARMCDGRVPAFYAALHPAFHSPDTPGREVLRQMATPEALSKLGTSESFPGAGDGEPPDHFTALHAAAWEGSCEAVNCLVDLGAPVDLKSERGHYPLSIAVRDSSFDSDPDALTRLAPPSILNAGDSRQRTALHWACNKGRARATKHLIGLGADVTLKAQSGRTPLHEAMRDMHFEIDHGQEVVPALVTPEVLKVQAKEANASTHEGSYAMHSAAFFGRENSIRKLHSLGGSVAVTDNDGHTPLHRAAARGHLRALEALIECGADVAATANDGKTAYAVAEGSSSAWQPRELEQARRLLYDGRSGTGQDAPAESPVSKSPSAGRPRRGSGAKLNRSVSFLGE